MIKTASLFLLLTMMLMSCREEVPTDDLMDDVLSLFMEECSEELLSTKNDIVDNLIGEWELLDHSHPIIPSDPLLKIELSFTADKLFFDLENESQTITDTLLWEIVINDEINPTSFYLETTPSRSELILTRFCESHMFGQTSPINDGGSMFLYQKK